MNKSVFSGLLLVLLSVPCIHSQQGNSWNSVYIEFGGRSFTGYSVNYERLLCKINENYRFTGSVGIGSFTYMSAVSPDDHTIIGTRRVPQIPLALNYIIGEKDWFVETGVSLNIVDPVHSVAQATMGILYRPSNKNFLIRANINPLSIYKSSIENDGFCGSVIGFSFGTTGLSI